MVKKIRFFCWKIAFYFYYILTEVKYFFKSFIIYIKKKIYDGTWQKVLFINKKRFNQKIHNSINIYILKMYPSIFRPKRQSDYILYKLNRKREGLGCIIYSFFMDFLRFKSTRDCYEYRPVRAFNVGGKQFSGGVAARIALFGSASCCCLHVSPVSRKHAYRDHAPGISRNRLLIACFDLWLCSVICEV